MDKISLKIPNKAQYLSSLRLLVSGILSSHGIDIETMEDLKIAVTEGCNIALELQCNDYIDIDFEISEEEFTILIGHICQKEIEEREELYLSTTIIDCLVDETKMIEDKMYLKKHLK
ncbi:anti-sigma factor [Peptoniphilus stercorisuis]|uniref:Serine/threonine-protein kinase RsbW n=1 Tax=Peptoniphilus stercorisuis TaxID=1436965 RepID=A0ABS4KCR1_9FIRM|nr:anti-sigma factor [Peptoniphilus stercorisuis]MBP2025559.1 serine/threonine-protein kinase RsbW [Peptoniphilus stercorisuis]